MPTPYTTLHNPGASNVFVPGATGLLQVEFSRNPESFAFNQYCQVVPNMDIIGYYPVIDTDEAIRVANTDDYMWPDGQDAPTGDKRPLKWEKWVTERKAYPFVLGNRTVDAAEFDVIASHARMAATKAMTDRSIQAATVLTTSGNWGTYTTATDQNWLASTGTNIQGSFHAAIESIQKNTGGVVRPADICVVINPKLAHDMARTNEIRAYMVNHESAMNVLGDQAVVPGYNLPRVLYGVKVVVEDAVKVTARRDQATTAQSTGGAYLVADNEAVFMSRPGGLVSNGGPSFSTLTCFMHEDMTVETQVDPWNRRTMGRVVEDRDIVLTAPAAGFFYQDVVT